MISDAEVRREARRAGVQPSVIDLDYVLGWALWGLGSHSYLQPRLLFKDVSGSEAIVFEPALRPIGHPYSDAIEMGDLQWRCYTLEEMLAEKVRALIGQRRYAISRDLYDIYAVIQIGVDEERIRAVMPTKLASKDISDVDTGFERMIGRKAEFATDWDRNLRSLLPSGEPPEFEKAWTTALEFIERVLTKEPRR